MVVFNGQSAVRVVYPPSLSRKILHDYVCRPWLLDHKDLIGIIRDNNEVSVLKITLAPTPWMLMNRKSPSLEMANRVLSLLGTVEVKAEAVANSVLRREALCVQKDLYGSGSE